MATFRYGPLHRIVNVSWRGGEAYAIIIAEGSYAVPNPNKKVKLIAQKTGDIFGVTGNAVTATLLEPPLNAGADCAKIFVSAGVPGAPERVELIVVPKSKAAKDGWWEMYVRPISGERAIPTAPFFWMLQTMNFGQPREIKFKIRNEPHLQPPPGKVRMVQMIPNTGSVEDSPPHRTRMSGYTVLAYRTDQKGKKTIYQAPPEWLVDQVTDRVVGGLGLSFGKDPPLINTDIPMDP